MSGHIYLEGGRKGPKSKSDQIKCREAFRKLLEKMGFSGKMPRLIACGGRSDAFDQFKLGLGRRTSGYVALWIDSETSVQDQDRPWQHLVVTMKTKKWKRPEGATDDQLLLMVTCMEGWILADRRAIRKFFGKDFQESALPSSAGLEHQEPDELFRCLVHASRHCKSQYGKGSVSFSLLSEVDPAALTSLESFKRVERILKNRL